MRRYGLIGAALFSLALSCAHAQEVGSNFDRTFGKLPTHVLPRAYTIELVPDIAQLSNATGQDSVGFTGVVQIDIEVRQPVTAIVLNANDIAFTRATIDGVASQVEADQRRQTAKIIPPRTLSIGRHTMAIEYSGTILTHQEGLFYSIYDTPEGRRWVLATDLEPSGARRIFPGWDEPSFKATFSLSVTVPATFRAVSNMPLLGERADGATRKIVTFATTPRMSSYLLVLAAGEYDRAAAAVDGIDVGVVLPRHQAAQGRYALGVATRTLAYFNDYFGVKYPLPKLDNIVVPRNFTGAMENWGGVIYSERALLFDETSGTDDDRKTVHEYVVHELAHQWFGNLVTMRWWDDLWLNEGFASWMEKKLTDEFNPSMKVWVRTRADKEKAMAKDALRTAHPVQQPIEDESEALAAFDDITYLKGLSLVRMLEAYVGEAAIPRRASAIYGQARLFKRKQRRPVGGAGVCFEQADRRHRTWFHQPARNPADPGVDKMFGRQACGHAEAEALRAQRSLCGTADLAGARGARPARRRQGIAHRTGGRSRKDVDV